MDWNQFRDHLTVIQAQKNFAKSPHKSGATDERSEDTSTSESQNNSSSPSAALRNASVGEHLGADFSLYEKSNNTLIAPSARSTKVSKASCA